MDDGPASSRRPLLLLAAGALLGVAAAALGLLRTDPRHGGLPDDAVAAVNGTPILRETYERLVAGLESDTRSPVTPELRQRVLDRMIDEELLVQRGLELGLAESDRRVRADLTQAVINAVVVEAEDEEPTREDLERFHREETAFFTQPGRVRVAQVFVRVRAPADEMAARARADAASQRLADGEDFEAVRAELGDEEVSPVPDALLPLAKLREYVGPTALRAVMEQQPGAVGAPVRSGTGYHVFVVREREPERTPPLDEIEEQVRAEWVRRAGDRALREYLDELRAAADVAVAAAP
jgi:parvulin-like peptidyl-prolyl isomerase